MERAVFRWRPLPQRMPGRGIFKEAVRLAARKGRRKVARRLPRRDGVEARTVQIGQRLRAAQSLPQRICQTTRRI